MRVLDFWTWDFVSFERESDDILFKSLRDWGEEYRTCDLEIGGGIANDKVIIHLDTMSKFRR